MSEAVEEVGIWAGLIDEENGEPLSDRIPVRVQITRTGRDVKVGRSLTPLSFKGTKPKPFVIAFFWAETGGEPFHISDPGKVESVELNRIQ